MDPRTDSRPDTTRRRLLAAALGAAGLSILPVPGVARGLVSSAGANAFAKTDDAATSEASSQSDEGGGLPRHFPRQDPGLVQRVVGASHGDFDTVRELVGRSPELAKAQWDWGFGDWESALGAASHTGRREIAEFLISHGARPTLFSAAMLGQLSVVRAFITASPGIQAVPGPHGIPLLAHARAGGDAAASVVAYLGEVGGADGEALVPLSDERLGRITGTYRATHRGESVLFDLSVGRMGLTLARRDGVARRLVGRPDGSFHPAGAPSVRVVFETSSATEATGETKVVGENEVVGDPEVAAFRLRTGDLELRAVRWP